ncbi:MAG TPA: endopeptidase La, partial [candidate division Zixibacteria bacterium]|nr:endopeptidase La [candidate division Zixibacteria bacterium]
ARKVASGDASDIKVDAKNVKDYLGSQKFYQEVAERTSHVGVVPALAWTSAGGEILFVEATKMPGKKGLILTGQLGDVMKESVKAALSYLQSHQQQYGISNTIFENNDFHIHVPAGATPKDGPSAGITMCTALASVLINKPVTPGLAMTGEITLRGDVLPIGGIKQKALAAYRAGITKVILPRRNFNDLDEVPAEVKAKVEFIPVDRVSEVLWHALGMKIKEDDKSTARKKSLHRSASTGKKVKSPKK